MTVAQILAGVAAIAVACGVALTVAGLRQGPWQDAVALLRRRRISGRTALRSAGVLAAGLGAWLFTGWPTLGVGVAGAVIGLPSVVGADARAQDQIERVEAVEEWSRRVADILAIGVGLEQAVQTAARSAPAPIAVETSVLASRIAARMPTEVALRRFADDVADPTADLVVASLVLAARRRGPGVAAALTALADSVGEEVLARRRIEADRAKPRATARAVTVITVVIAGVGLLNRGYTDPYGTPLGQIVLAATIGFFAAALWWMHSMTRTADRPRVLGSADQVVR